MKKVAALVMALSIAVSSAFAGNYRSFKVSVYTRAYEVEKMADTEYLESTWKTISSQVKVDKIYLETHRDTHIVPQETLDAAKKFFKAHGVEVAGGITYTINERDNFHIYCYNTPEERAMVQHIAEYTAANFDEFILDDFFFTNCKCENCIEAKGDMPWDEFRLKTMTAAGRDLVIGPAKKVNPNVKVIIKYPNWYDDFQGLGFDLEHGPQIFDGIWTGTETRNPSSAQHLQNWFGMIGIPMDMHPDFPADSKVVFLTEQAKSDPELKDRIDRQLRSGGDVIVTTGLLKAVPDVIGQFVQCRVAGDVLVDDFGYFGHSGKDLLFPLVRYFTNDSWDIISMGRPLTDGTNGFPLMLRGSYSKGNLYVLSIPSDFSDLYELPAGVLNRLRQIMTPDLPVRIEGPAKVSLFVYDNDTFIVESFLDAPVDVTVVAAGEVKKIRSLTGNASVNARPGPEPSFPLTLQPHTYQAFKMMK